MTNSPANNDNVLGRRRALRAGGLALAGAAGMTVASAIPAHAAPGDNVVLGQANSSGAAGTHLTAASTDPTLTVDNTGTGGDLRLPPGDVDAWTPTVGVAKGSEAGPFIGIDPDGNGVQKAYLVTSWDLTDFATHLPLVYPVAPTRVLDTRTSSGRAAVLASSNTSPFTGAGKLVGGGWIDLSVAGVASGLDAVAVYVTLTVVGANAAGSGRVWASGTADPETTNISYQANQAVSSLAIAEVGSAEGQPAIRLWLSRTAHLVVDASAVDGSLAAGQADLQVAGKFSIQSLEAPAQRTPLRAPVRVDRDQLTRS
jgi:hypothetical protein